MDNPQLGLYYFYITPNLSIQPTLDQNKDIITEHYSTDILIYLLGHNGRTTWRQNINAYDQKINTDQTRSIRRTMAIITFDLFTRVPNPRVRGNLRIAMTTGHRFPTDTSAPFYSDVVPRTTGFTCCITTRLSHEKHTITIPRDIGSPP